MKSTEDIFYSLSCALTGERLGHALLLSSPHEAQETFEKPLLGFLKLMLCQNPQAQAACAQCESCKLLDQENWAHPDFAVLRPESGTGYSVEQIRGLLQRLSLSRSLSPRRVTWIAQADRLGAHGGAAGNALLKILEEPRPQSFFVLTSARPEALMPTLKSRSQHFRFPGRSFQGFPPDLAEWAALKGWLEEGAPLRAWGPSPADDEGFWQDRAAAVEEMERLFLNLWEHLKERWPEWNVGSGRRIYDFFRRFEEVILKTRHFANPHLQWLNLRMDAKLGSLWMS